MLLGISLHASRIHLQSMSMDWPRYFTYCSQVVISLGHPLCVQVLHESLVDRNIEEGCSTDVQNGFRSHPGSRQCLYTFLSFSARHPPDEELSTTSSDSRRRAPRHRDTVHKLSLVSIPSAPPTSSPSPEHRHR